MSFYIILEIVGQVMTRVNGWISRPVCLYIYVQTHSSCYLLSTRNGGDGLIMSFKEYEPISNTWGIANKKNSYREGISHWKELKDKREIFGHWCSICQTCSKNKYPFFNRSYLDSKWHIPITCRTDYRCIPIPYKINSITVMTITHNQCLYTGISACLVYTHFCPYCYQIILL